MNKLVAVLLGIIQSIADFLPISGSGFSKTISVFSGFDVISAEVLSALVHISFVIAVLGLFSRMISVLFAEFVSLLRDLLTGKIKSHIFTQTDNFIFSLMISAIPSSVLLIFRGFAPFKDISGDKVLLINAIGFLLTGFIIFFSYSGIITKRESNSISPVCSLVSGLFQGISLILPCFSSLAVTIAVCIGCGVPNKKALKFGLISNIPLSIIGCVRALALVNGSKQIIEILPLVLAFAVSMVFAFIGIKLVRVFLDNKKFKAFGFFNTIIGVAVAVAGAIMTFSK